MAAHATFCTEYKLKLPDDPVLRCENAHKHGLWYANGAIYKNVNSPHGCLRALW
jgi:hypothetical protein